MNLTNTSKNILRLFLITIAIVAGIYLVFKASLYFMPFLIAFVLSLFLEPIIKLFVSKLKLSRKFASLIALLIMLSTIGLVVTLLVLRLISEIKDIYNSAADYYIVIYDAINVIILKAKNIYELLPIEVSDNLGSIVTNLSTSLVNFLNTLAKGVLNTAISLPQAFVFLLVTILSTYFISSDRKNIGIFIQKQLPQGWINKALTFKDDMFSALFGYIKAQIILMTITFTQLSVGFWIIGIKNYLLLALVISFVDALPILGTGGIMVPWAIYCFVIGNIRMGISVFVLYGIVMIVRQLIEPKVLGEQIGVHPLLTLISMYAGLQMLGVIGLIIGPITILTVMNILTAVLKKQPLKEYIEKRSVNH